ncbi:hypothetical protein RJ640_016411, partial [Escallonia rubra]
MNEDLKINITSSILISSSVYEVIIARGEAAGAHSKHLWSRAEKVSNFIRADSILGPDARLVYKTYATLYFVFIFDTNENELAILDLMQVFVEALDKCFSNVCELDIVFNFNKVHTILDEIILGGQVIETSSSEVVKAVEESYRCSSSNSSFTPVVRERLQRNYARNQIHSWLA